VLLLVPNRRLRNVANVVLLLTKVGLVCSRVVQYAAKMHVVKNLRYLFVCRMVVDWQFDKIPEEQKVSHWIVISVQL
jgi:hypothetical protein